MLFFRLSDENEAEMKEKAAEDEDDSGNSDEEEDEEDDDDDDGVITEIRFVPSDKTACEWSHKPEQQADVSQRRTGIFFHLKLVFWNWNDFKW